ncbi:MAG: LemA family protein [Candidatus Micrarchaeia archaeon]
MERINFYGYLAVVIILYSIIGREDFLPHPEFINFKPLIFSIILIIPSLYFRHIYKKMDDIIFKIERLPLLDVNEATESVPFSGEGTIESEIDMRSPYTSTPCVYFHYIVEERAAKGGWVIKRNDAISIPFYLKDRRGNRIKIDLTGIDRDNSSYPINDSFSYIFGEKQIYSEVEGKFTVKRKIKEPPWYVLFGLGGTRVTELVLKPGSKVYVVGMVYKDDNNEYVLKEDKDWPLIVTIKSKKEYFNEFRKGEPIILWSHILIAIGYSLFLNSLQAFNILNPSLFWPAFIIGNGIIMGSIVFTMYNRIIELEERCNSALSTIDVELKRRADLIPKIVEFVKNYKEYEKEIQTMVAETRSTIVMTKDSTDKKDVKMVYSLIESLEAYPELKADENFMRLMTELKDTEERIAQTRKFYNDTALRYNDMISRVPTVIMAFLLGMKKKKYLSFSYK